MNSNSSHSKRRGSVLPLVALSITVLLGAAALSVDYAVLLSDKNQLQRACDASALAGAAYLKRSSDEAANTNNARQQAMLVASLNNLAPGEVPAGNVTFSDNNTKIRVTALRARSLFFARIFGILRGNISASAAAVAKPNPVERVPIAITPTSKARYQNDGLPHDFTLIAPQDKPFQTGTLGITPFDPFTVFDLSSSQGKSPTQMQRQLEGDLAIPVNPQKGDQLTGMSANTGTIAKNFKEGIAPRFEKAAQSPWLDPITGVSPLTQSWQLVGTRLSEVLRRTGAPDNPRIVTFVVVEELATRESNHNFTIQDFATAYISSVQDTPGGLTFTATFLPPGMGAASEVSLVE